MERAIPKKSLIVDVDREAGVPGSGGRAGRRQLSQARAEETRSRILQCARDAFAAYGFAAANVRDIARAAGTTHSMITYHFGSKDELWRESVRDMFALLQRSVVDIVDSDPGLTPRDRFRKLLRRYTRYSAEHPEHARITVAESIAGGERLEWMVEEFVKSNHSDTMPQLEALIADGTLRPMPLPSLFYAMVGMIQLPFMFQKEAQLAMGYDFMSDAAIDAHAEAVLALLLPNESARGTS
ncbi:TetR/AcrR family transcriptional regulator [Novosphingobium sp. P6W]|uniref:TetR/AcrR family transcriptional regulator n=1 Tax=Novosphingobium sp. P6W TaxID=1609758 RepID=UPI000696D2E6|nr:TetR/AcrR family transcriptional regulator [Novosphingobium sp. P6W]AXB75858.1 TetR/AcrR family transcriptional regulator [Novosphingobium sp. P6W]